MTLVLGSSRRRAPAVASANQEDWALDWKYLCSAVFRVSPGRAGAAAGRRSAHRDPGRGRPSTGLVASKYAPAPGPGAVRKDRTFKLTSSARYGDWPAPGAASHWQIRVTSPSQAASESLTEYSVTVTVTRP